MKKSKTLSPFGQWIVDRIESLNFQVSEVAAKAKVSRTGLHYIMRGERTPDPKTLAAICKALGVSVEEAQKFVTPRSIGRPTGSKNRKRKDGKRMEQST